MAKTKNHNQLSPGGKSTSASTATPAFHKQEDLFIFLSSKLIFPSTLLCLQHICAARPSDMACYGRWVKLSRLTGGGWHYNMIMIEWGDMGSQSPRIRCVDKYVVLDLDILCLVSTNHAGNANPSVWVCLVKRSLQVSENQLSRASLTPMTTPQFIITSPEAEIRCLLMEWNPLCEKGKSMYNTHQTCDDLNRFFATIYL